MKLSAKLTVILNLNSVSNSLENFKDLKNSKHRLEFIEYIITNCKGDLNQDIDPEEMYGEMMSRSIKIE